VSHDRHPGTAEPRGNPREVGDLLATWVGVKLDEIDDLTEEARRKVAEIPEWHPLIMIVGELLVRLSALELEVAELRKARRR
jgi:hypothetical protein